MTKLCFSIIIPTLNEEKFLPRLLNNLKVQKEKNFETIIVDGNSVDGTKNIVENFKKSLPINFFQVDKRNVSYQRNFGARKARGRYLVFLDADCEVSPSFTRNLQKNINIKKGLFFIPFLLPDRQYVEYKVIFNFINLFIELTQNFHKPFSAGGSMVIDKYFFELLGGFNERLFISEDHDLVKRSHQWGVKAKFLPSVKVRFSLRRLKREGQLKLFYKYLIATAQYLLGGETKKKFFDYEMGGQAYQKSNQSNRKQKLFRKHLQQVKKILKKIT